MDSKGLLTTANPLDAPKTQLSIKGNLIQK